MPKVAIIFQRVEPGASGDFLPPFSIRLLDLTRGSRDVQAVCGTQLLRRELCPRDLITGYWPLGVGLSRCALSEVQRSLSVTSPLTRAVSTGGGLNMMTRRG
jgi:hypothetical protein